MLQTAGHALFKMHFHTYHETFLPWWYPEQGNKPFLSRVSILRPPLKPAVATEPKEE